MIWTFLNPTSFLHAFHSYELKTPIIIQMWQQRAENGQRVLPSTARKSRPNKKRKSYSRSKLLLSHTSAHDSCRRRSCGNDVSHLVDNFRPTPLLVRKRFHTMLAFFS